MSFPQLRSRGPFASAVTPYGTASGSEAILVAEVLSVDMTGDRAVTVPSESIKVRDTLTVDAPLQVVRTEAIRVSSGGEIRVYGVIHSTESLTPPPNLSGGAVLTPPLLTEAIKVSDPVTVVLSPLAPSALSEAIKV